MARAGCRARLGAQPAALELGHRRVEVAHPETQYRRISLQVLGQQACTICGEKSLEMSRPSSPRRLAARKPVSPVPAASSRSVCPGFGSTWSTSQSLTLRVDFHVSFRRRSQGLAILSQSS